MALFPLTNLSYKPYLARKIVAHRSGAGGRWNRRGWRGRCQRGL